MYLSCCLSVLVISTPRILVSVSRIFLFSKGSSINYIITFGGLGRIIYFIFYCYLIQTNFYQFEIICYQLQLFSNLDDLVSKKGKV